MDSIQAVSLLLGMVTPLAVSVVSQPRWTATQKRILSILIAVIVGSINMLLRSEFLLGGVGDALANIVLVVGASQAAYSLLWKPTGVAPALEKATSPVEAE